MNWYLGKINTIITPNLSVKSESKSIKNLKSEEEEDKINLEEDEDKTENSGKEIEPNPESPSEEKVEETPGILNKNN